MGRNNKLQLHSELFLYLWRVICVKLLSSDFIQSVSFSIMFFFTPVEVYSLYEIIYGFSCVASDNYLPAEDSTSFYIESVWELIRTSLLSDKNFNFFHSQLLESNLADCFWTFATGHRWMRPSLITAYKFWACRTQVPVKTHFIIPRTEWLPRLYVNN